MPVHFLKENKLYLRNEKKKLNTMKTLTQVSDVAYGPQYFFLIDSSLFVIV